MAEWLRRGLQIPARRFDSGSGLQLFKRDLMRHFLILPLMALAACQQAPAKIEVSDAWARATAPGQPMAAVYATLANRGGEADRLTGASTKRASMAMVHIGSSEGGVARMRMVDGVDIPAGATASLAPGGTHIMLEGLTAPLAAGETIELVLRFAKSVPQRVPVTVVAAGAQ